MTRDQVKDLIAELGYANAKAQEKADFINGIRHAEIFHDIKKGGAA